MSGNIGQTKRWRKSDSLAVTAPSCWPASNRSDRQSRWPWLPGVLRLACRPFESKSPLERVADQCEPIDLAVRRFLVRVAASGHSQGRAAKRESAPSIDPNRGSPLYYGKRRQSWGLLKNCHVALGPETLNLECETPTRPRRRSDHERKALIAAALVGLALFIVVFSISDPEMGIGRATFYPHHLIFASAVVVLFAYIFSRRKRSESAEECSQRAPETASSSNNIAWLALAAFIGGPVLTLAAGLVCVTAFNVHPMDRASVVGSLVTLGFIVGTLVAVVLAVVGKIR